MNTIIFSPATYNLAETLRALAIAKACRDRFNCLFISYGGRFEELIKQEGFEVVKLTPHLNNDKIRFLYQIEWGQRIEHLFSPEEVHLQVKNEIALLKEIKPSAVMTGFTLSNSISCRVLKIPLVWLTQSTWMVRDIYQNGLGAPADLIDLPLIRSLPESLLKRACLTGFDVVSRFLVGPYDRIAKKYGLNPFERFEKLWVGDYNLLAEPENFCELSYQPPTYHYIGPIIDSLDWPVPDEIAHIPRDKPIVYFAMGSSGQTRIVHEIIKGFESTSYRVIAPVKELLHNTQLKIPENILVTGWLPAPKVNPLADISLIHGGIGTVMTAAMAGVPIVGIAMQFEQEFNLDCLVRKGFAIRLRRRRATPTKIIEAIDHLLSDEQAKNKARTYQAQLQGQSGALNAANFLYNTFGLKAEPSGKYSYG